jgi:hypothetical protein
MYTFCHRSARCEEWGVVGGGNSLLLAPCYVASTVTVGLTAGKTF